jgi:hypothetical protein
MLIKKSNLLLLLLAVAAVSSLLVVSCHNKLGQGNDKNRVVIEIPADKSGLDKIDHFINARDIEVYKSIFRGQAEKFNRVNIHVPEAEAFNKRALLSLLKANDCVGIRIYQGAKIGKDGQKAELRLVLVGVDSNGKDILIDRSSALTAQFNAELGGEENGQCPSCLSDFQ